MPRTIAEIDVEIERLKRRRAAAIARETAEQRRKRARQAIIIGSWLLANRPDVVEQIKLRLTRSQDRAAFDLPATEGASPTSSDSSPRP